MSQTQSQTLQIDTKSENVEVKSDIVDITQNKSNNIYDLEKKILDLEDEIEKKNCMLQTAASAGQQLVIENDDLHKKVKDITKQLNHKQDELDTLKKTNEMLKITATRSGAEADELHKELVESHKIIEQLREDNALLTSMNEQPPTLTRQPSDSFDKQSANDLITKLKHEKATLEQFLQSEQDKCAQFLQNAEINARNYAHAQNENQDLKQQLDQLKHEISELNHSSQHEIRKYDETIHQLHIEIDTLRHQLNESQQIVNNQNQNIITSPIYRHVSNASNGSRASNEHFSDGGLGAELAELGYFEQDARLLSTDNVHADEESHDFSSVQTPTKQFRKASIDAQEEFVRLTVIAAKIKFNDVGIATSTLLEKVKEAQLSFHEVADWLNEYLMKERRKRQKLQEKADSRARVRSITDKQMEASVAHSPSRHFFRKIRNLADSVTNFSSTLRLEVRFGRRVFEVKMKKQDKLETLLQTLPRIIGEDAEAMEIYNGKRRLNPTLSLMDLELNNNDILRMIHKKKAASYLRRYERKLSGDANGIEMESEEVIEEKQ